MPRRNEDVDEGILTPYIFNQKNVGLCIRDKNGDLQILSSISIACEAFLATSNLSLNGYVFVIQFNKEDPVVRKRVFVPKSSTETFAKFESQVDLQAGIPFQSHLGKFKKFWPKFISERIDKVLNDNRRKKMHFVELEGLQVHLLGNNALARENERWVFSPDTVLDSTGKMLTGAANDMFWFKPLLENRKDPIYPCSSIPPSIPGGRTGREIMAELIKCSNPDNPFVFQLCLCVMMHGKKLRQINGGQLPLFIITGKGKAQGKSTTAKIVIWLQGDETNGRKLMPMDIRSLKQYGSRTSLSLWVEDVGKTTLLKDIAQMRYDDDQSYLNSKGRFAIIAEFVATSNKIDPLKVDERDTDRMAIFPFSNTVAHSEDFSRRQSMFYELLSSNTKPFDFMIGEMGDFYASQKYLDLREKWGKVLDSHCTGLVKQRTIMNNYAPVYATLEYFHHVFKSVYEEIDLDLAKFEEWLKSYHIKQMQILHVETDHAVSYVRRFCLGLLEWARQQSLQKRLQHMRIVATGKVKSGIALGFAPTSEPAFRELMGTVLPLVKQHVVSLGGRVDSADDHITVNLLKDCVDLPEDVVKVEVQGEWSSNKRGMLIEPEAIPSSLWCDICTILEQQEHFISPEAPTGVSEISSNPQLESTAQGRESLGLNLDISSIHIPRTQSRALVDKDVEFDEHDTLADMSMTLEERGEVLDNPQPDGRDNDIFDEEEIQPIGNASLPPVPNSAAKSTSPAVVSSSLPTPVVPPLPMLPGSTSAANSTSPTVVSSSLPTLGVPPVPVMTSEAVSSLETTSDAFIVPESFPCNECGKTFSTAQKRNGHMSSHRRATTRRLSVSASLPSASTQPTVPHNLTAPNPFACEECDRTFQSARGKASHKRTHKK